PELNPQQVVKVDFGATAQEVQEGFNPFTEQNSPAGSSISRSFATPFTQEGSDLVVTVGGNSTWGFRDRGDDVAGPIGRVQDDLVFANGRMSLTLENLAAGDYHLVLYSHDRNFEQDTFD